MNGKKLSILFAGLSAVLVIVCIVLVAGQDRTAPEISFTDSEVVYSQGMDMEPLYEGVTAVDDREGDITDKIVIEKIVEAADGKSVSVTYAVNDSSNNFAKKVRVFEQLPIETEEAAAETTAQIIEGNANTPEEEEKAAQEQLEREEAEAAAKEAEEQAKKEEEEKAKKEAEEQAKQEEEEKARKEAEDRARQEADEQSQAESEEGENPKSQPPVLELAEKEVTTRVGVRPAWVNIIKTLTDDKDNYDTLYKNLVLDGTYNDSKSGDYDVTLRTSDSDGNKSAVCKLKIHVLP